MEGLKEQKASSCTSSKIMVAFTRPNSGWVCHVKSITSPLEIKQHHSVTVAAGEKRQLKLKKSAAISVCVTKWDIFWLTVEVLQVAAKVQHVLQPTCRIQQRKPFEKSCPLANVCVCVCVCVCACVHAALGRHNSH